MAPFLGTGSLSWQVLNITSFNYECFILYKYCTLHYILQLRSGLITQWDREQEFEEDPYEEELLLADLENDDNEILEQADGDISED